MLLGTQMRNTASGGALSKGHERFRMSVTAGQRSDAAQSTKRATARERKADPRMSSNAQPILGKTDAKAKT